MTIEHSKNTKNRCYLDKTPTPEAKRVVDTDLCYSPSEGSSTNVGCEKINKEKE